MEWSLGKFYDEVDEIFSQLVTLCNAELEGKDIKVEPFMPESESRGEGRTLFVANGSAREGVIRLGMLSNLILWHLCWYGYMLWKMKDDDLDLDGLMQRLHSIDSCSPAIEEMSIEDMKMWDDENLSLVFAYATNFIIGHEMAHIVYMHDPFDKNYDIKPIDELRSFEYSADAYSMHAINKLAKNRGQLEEAYIGVIIVQCLMFFIRKAVVDYVNDPHGDPMVRIELKLNDIKSDNNRYCELVKRLKSFSDRFISEKFANQCG